MSEHWVVDTHGIPSLSKRAGSDGASLAWMKEYSRRISARYDAANTSIENERWWAHADNLSPYSANRRDTRKRLRSRSRYECIESNSYARGMVLTKVDDVIGEGPTLQVTTGDRALNQLIEAEFQAWADEVGLAEKLRTMAMAKTVDGEAFCERITNEQHEHPVTLDLALSEADLWTDPFWTEMDPQEDDGIRFDRAGNPIRFRRLVFHPGDSRTFGDPWETEDLSSDDVIHWYRVDRPGQTRGIPELAPGLPLFAELRRMVLAVVSAHETAAEFAAIMYSDASAFSDEPDEIDPNLYITLNRRAMMTLPSGWKMEQLKAEHPSSTYEMFEERILMQIARNLRMPLNIASGSSRRHNFASGRLDYLLWWNACDVERSHCAKKVLSRIFRWWLEEARLIRDYLPPIPARLQHQWFFPKRRPVDEVAAARAKEINWNMGFWSDEQEAVERSMDVERWEEEMRETYRRRRSIDENFPLPGIATSESLQPDIPSPLGTEG